MREDLSSQQYVFLVIYSPLYLNFFIERHKILRWSRLLLLLHFLCNFQGPGPCIKKQENFLCRRDSKWFLLFRRHTQRMAPETQRYISL